MTTKPVLAITMGDPTGVGPEVCLHLLANAELAKSCTVQFVTTFLTKMASTCHVAFPRGKVRGFAASEIGECGCKFA